MRKKKAAMSQLSPSPVLGVADLHRMLVGMTPVTDEDGNLRIEIIRGGRRRNQILWVPWEEAAHLLTQDANRAALMAWDTPTEGEHTTGELP